MQSTVNTLESQKTQTTKLEHALRYAALGIRVFPLRPGTKIPATVSGVKDATVDAATIAKWWTDSPDAGIGLAPELRVGGACFLEFDQKPTLREWAKNEGQEMPVTRVHRSGGKGAPHFIFTHTEKSLALGNCDGSTNGHEWFSFRAANRYIVAPPSIHPDSGEPYTTWADIEPTPIPDWVVDRIRVNGTREQDFAGGMPEVDEDFDIEAFLNWIPVGTGIEDGSWIPFDECPVVGRRHRGQGDRGCALFYDGRLGFKCHAAECPSNANRKPGQSGISYLVSFLSKEYGAYDGVIWPEREDQMGAVNAEEAELIDQDIDEPKPMPDVTKEYLKRNSEAALAAQAALAPKPADVVEEEAKPEEPVVGAKKMYRMPESCMYGWIGDFCRTLQCPLDVAYPMALAYAAGMGVPYANRTRSNLFMCAIGPKGWGKTRTFDRIRESWAYPKDVEIIEKYPGSEIGLVELLGGKKKKEESEEDLIPKPYLLFQDELRSTFSKMGIENSSLPFAFNHLFSKDEFGTASKKGHYTCRPKLNVIGGLTCSSPSEFAEVFGKATQDGTYDRFIFAETPLWEFDDRWEPTEVSYRRPGACHLPDVVFEMKREWVAKDRQNRLRLGELALRIALITSSINHDTTVTEKAMECALEFMEWQEALRYKYVPSEMSTIDGKCDEAIRRALALHPGKWVPWRKLCAKYNLYRHGGATVVKRVYSAMVSEGVMEETSMDSAKKDGQKGKRIKLVRLAAE